MAGRPSKLTDRQWGELGRRLAMGESTSSLSREFKVSRAAITLRFSDRVENIKAVANQIVETNSAIERLPFTDRVSAITMADHLQAIGGDLAQAAKYGAKTAHKLAKVASIQAEKVDEKNPMEDPELLQGISALGKLANEAGKLGLDMMTAISRAKAEPAPGEDANTVEIHYVRNVIAS